MQLQNESYQIFYNAVELVSNFCTDVVIKDNVIRQLSDDKVLILNCTIHLNEKLTLNLSDIKSKLKIFKIFYDSENIDVDVSTNIIVMKDKYTDLKIAHPSEDVLINRFINDDDFSSKIDLSDSTKILECELETNIIERINVLTSNFNTRKIILYPHEDAKCSLQITSQDRNHKADVIKYDLLNPIEEKIIVANDLFTIFNDNVIFEVYRKNNWFLCCTRGEINNVEVKLYSRGGTTDE